LIKTNVIYGVIFLIPLAIMALLFARLVEFLTGIANALKLESTWGAALAVVVALAALLVVCFVVGALVRTRLGAASFERFEAKALQRVPGYQLISNVLKGFAGDASSYRPAMISLHGPGSAVLGLIMEENDNDTVTVFVPSSPVMTVGTVYVVRRERVTNLNAGMIDATNCITQWGIGTRKLLGTNPLPAG
jgi:uncharacterized membrane protein